MGINDIDFLYLNKAFKNFNYKKVFYLFALSNFDWLPEFPIF